MTDDELHDRLEQFGSSDGPAVDPAFANRLETDLRLTGLRDDLSTARPWWQPVIMASVVLVMLVAGFSALRDRGQETEVVMTAADDTRIVLPDGTELEGAEGIELADGTRIFVGPDGSATVGGVVLGGGTEGVVVDGHVEIVHIAGGDNGDQAELGDSGPANSPPPTTAGRSTTTSRDAATTTRPRASTTSGSSTSVTPSTSTTSARPTSASSTQSTASEPADRQPPTTETDRELDVVLTATSEGAGLVRLTWTAASVPDLAGWRVMATAGDRTTVVLIIREVNVREATLEQSDGRVSYRLVAVDSDGAVLAESNLAAL